MFYHFNLKFTLIIIIATAVVFAQFPMNQFCSIGWFNAVMGMPVIFIQILMFKGEMNCTRQSKNGILAAHAKLSKSHL